jgi:predicted nucleic acid-binding Zn ribbon protein
MPIYVYEVIRADGQDGATFEVLQSMSEPPLTKHPDTGDPVRRCIALPSIAGTWTDMKSSSNLSDKNLDAKGFTKYVKMGDGMYEKRAGQGPDVISANDYQ